MKTTPITIVLSIAAAVAVATAPVAAADSDSYIKLLDNLGVHYSSVGAAIDLGNAICADLRQGADPGAEVKQIVSGGIGAHDAGVFMGAAASELCHDQNARVQQWANS